jgi:hypothetical protein
MNRAEAFWFVAVFWGKEYREYFLKYCLASLMSPGNIPALPADPGHRFLFCTTEADWAAVQDDPMVRRLRRHMAPELVDISTFRQGPDDPRDPSMARMSYGHLLATERAFKSRAVAVVVCPDVIFSDGAVGTLRRAVAGGKKAVIALGLRMRTETLLPALAQAGRVVDGQPMTLSGRELVRFCIEHYHSESEAFHFDAPYFAAIPVSCIWTVPGQGAVVHTFSWAALLMDFGAIDRHRTECLEKWTMDGDYVSQNVADPGDIHVVTDSDELFMASFTKESSFSYPKYVDYWRTSRLFRVSHNVALIRQLKDSSIMDPLKRKLFRMPILLHTNGLTPELAAARDRAEAIIERVYRAPGRREVALLELESQVAASGLVPAEGIWFAERRGGILGRAIRLVGAAIYRFDSALGWWLAHAADLARRRRAKRALGGTGVGAGQSTLEAADPARGRWLFRIDQRRAANMERQRARAAHAAERRASRIALAKERRASRRALAEERRLSFIARIDGIVGGYLRAPASTVPVWRKILGAAGVQAVRYAIAPVKFLKPLVVRLGLYDKVVALIERAARRMAG